LQKKLDQIKTDTLSKLKSANSLKEITEIKNNILSKKGTISLLMRELGSLSNDEKPIMGKLINETKTSIIEEISKKESQLENAELEQKLLEDKIDITLPGKKTKKGTIHPLTQTLEEIKTIFAALGYTVAQGPEIEDDFHNFEALNIPPDHPAREMHDTFYFDDNKLLRTHTSPVQIHTMLKNKPPIKIIAPGRVYRRDADVSHSPVFHQLEGLYINTDVTFADLKGTLQHFINKLFGSREIRLRPSYFPFTEPSAEIDVQCVICDGKGCRVCKGTGWLEILGAGMVDPNVFDSVSYDKTKYRGFAFGMGIERIAMLKFGIDNIKLFYESNLRFLSQF
jgi:phenylalanyl-tRNA synthetase alpha chain